VLANSASCPAAKAWLDRLAPLQAAQGRITNNAVITAAMPVLRPIPGLVQKVDAVRRLVDGAMAGPGSSGVMLRTRSGTSVYYEGPISNGFAEGVGAMIADNRVMTRGNYQAGRLSGDGQRIHTAGLVEVGKMADGGLNGEGARQLPDGVVMVGHFEENKPQHLLETFYPDGRSQKAFFNEPDKVLAAGPMAAPGQVAEAPDQQRLTAWIQLSSDCFRKVMSNLDFDPAKKVQNLRELVRGPCGADRDTVKLLADAEKEAGIAASQERERAAQQAAEQAAAAAQANEERTAMFRNFLGQVSSILGSYQAAQQMAAVEAGSGTAVFQSAGVTPSAPGSGSGASVGVPGGGGQSGVGMQRPVGMVAVSAVPGCAVYSLLPREFGRAYFQIHNPCPHGIEVYVKIEVNGQWTTYADMNRGIEASRTAKSNGGIPGSGTFQPSIMAVCPSREHLERQLGARLTGVYTRNNGQFGCWIQYENTGVGRSN
jgi:hypothetical protein